MAEAKEAAADKKSKGKNAEAKKPKHDPRMVKHIARVVSGLAAGEWNKLDKENRKPHLKTARKVLTVQKKVAAKPPKRASEGQRAESAKA